MPTSKTDSDHVAISLSKGSWLVIFEYLAHSYDVWGEREKKSDDTFVLLKPDAGERTALWHLESAIESTLPDIFGSNYRELISKEKERLVSSTPKPAQS